MLNFLKKNRPVYLKQHEFFYHQTLYRFIRYLAEYDIELADDYFHNQLPGDFSPKYSKATYIPLWNAKMVNLIGFKKAEYLKQYVKQYWAWGSNNPNTA